MFTYKQLAARIGRKASAALDNLDAKLQDPKEMERLMQNALAYGAFALAALTVPAVIIDAFINHRFAWWGLCMGFFILMLGKALYIPSEKKILPTAEQVRARLISYKEETERRISASLLKVRVNESETAQA